MMSFPATIVFSAFWFYTKVSAVLVFIYYVVSSVRSYWRLRHFKGPPLAAWTDLWYVRAAVGEKQHLALSEALTQYGSLVRIGPNTLVTSDTEMYKRINTRRSGYYKGDWYKGFRFGAEKENLFSETENERHITLRKQFGPGYSGRENSHLEADMDAVILSLVRSWKERYISSGNITRPMDFAVQTQYLMLDIITSMYLGEPFGWVRSNTDLYAYLETMATNFPIMNFMAAVPILSRITRIPWVQRNLAPSVKDRVGLGKLKALSGDIVALRFKEDYAYGNNNSKKDMAASFMTHKLTLDEITDGTLLTILAGSDTTGSAIRTGFVFIQTSPRVLRRLQAECDEANVALDQVISHARAKELTYLQACIKEVLRFHPPSGGLLPRVVPPQGDYFEGKFIPGGTIIGHCQWSMQRLNYSVYGADADVFRPERWLEAAEEAKNGQREKYEKMEKTIELGLGYGDHRCLGADVAKIQLGKIFFELFRRFEYDFMNGLEPMKTHRNFGIHFQEGMWLRVEDRWSGDS